MEKQKKKIGARILSESEINMILPGAKSVYEQIEVFRSNADSMSGEQQEYEQRTNNIGIMGGRGAGKTSVMRSFHKKLKEESKKKGDIILPIIVPENMSSSATLMDVILGMLKSEVIDGENRKKGAERGECIYTGRDSLEKTYNEMVKKYCYIKKDYRDILIQQFTTEQYYVDKTKEVFNSDTEFIKQFSDFISRLLDNRTDSDTKGMVFLFIDDIDLSTTRCMDVVRTLLSYLSNPRIVTIISGDLETFEEALTLDFLRQEKALSADVIEKTYYSTTAENCESELLERKKTMAYEYLKKIIPPAYRKSIRYWSLDDRGYYQIADEEGKPQPNLAELLVEVTGERAEKSYFVYQEKEEKKFLNVTFHLFDDTSRGLNNVYSVLQELREYETVEKKDDASETKRTLLWRVLESIVDSKPLYTKYRRQLLEQIIVLTQEGIRVDFCSAHNWLYEDGKKETDSGATEKKKRKRGLSSEERFAVFLLADFTAGLFLQKKAEDEIYTELKNQIIEEYIRDETIEGKIAPLRDIIKLEGIAKNKDKWTIRFILMEFLRRGDFIFDLYLIKYLGREDIYAILEGKCQDWEAAYKVAYALMRTVWAMRENADEQKDYLVSLYLQMPDAVMALFSMLPLNPEVVYGRQLVRNISVNPGGMNYWGQGYNLSEASYWNEENYIAEAHDSANAQFNLLWALENFRKLPYWVYYEKCVRENVKQRVEFDIQEMAKELICQGMAKTFVKQVAAVMDQYQVAELRAGGYGSFAKEKEKAVICKIDENNLWKHPYVKEKIYPYLCKKKDEYVIMASEGRILLDASAILELQGAYSEFRECYKGSSGKALANKLEEKLEGIFFLGNGSGFSDGKYYMRMEQVLVILCTLKEFLENHKRVRYGKKETRQLLMAMQELPVALHTPGWERLMEEVQKREEAFFGQKGMRPEDWGDRILGEERNVVIKELFNKNNSTGNIKMPIKVIIENYMKEKGKEWNKDDWVCLAYLVQKEEISKLLNSNDNTFQRDEWEKEYWEKIEKEISEEKLRFYLHSYLRYLQANDSDAKQAGVQAETVATLTRYLLESEQLADEKLQNEIYELLSKDMELTEEEFENLF